MSGILDNKSRVIDAILTYEGRRQMAEGNFVVKYATFTDKAVVYQLDSNEGHVDPTQKIYLEAFNSPYDQITFEADDSGKLTPFRQHISIGETTVTGSVTGSVSWNAFVNGKIKNRIQQFATDGTYAGSFSESAVNGANFASELEGLLTSSIDNFNNLMILGTADSLFEDYNFALNTKKIKFTVRSDSTTQQMVPPTNINTIDSLFSDEKLRNVDNFKYLPPIKKASFSVDKTDINQIISNNLLLGDYPPWGPVEKLTFSEINKELKNYEEDVKVISFDPTSRDNEIVAQFFEITNDEAKKLDVIDYGKVNDNTSNPKAVTHHVFFVGKVLTDDTGSNCFVHLFTLVFGPDSEEE
jgi:hypothetical protein